MKFRFPLSDVVIEISGERREVKTPLFSDGLYTIGLNEFSMDVPGTGWFYSCDGSFVSINPAPGADKESVELYLNGSVLGALLHQRGIMPLHGSSFRYNGEVVMICGDAGAGKSSVTALFCQRGAEFVTDDVSPVILRNGKPFILSLSSSIKLRKDVLDLLGASASSLQPAGAGTEKYHLPVQTGGRKEYSPGRIYIITPHDGPQAEIEEITGHEKFEAVRNEIYRPEYLQGMPGNDRLFFKTVLEICNNAGVFRVKRPPGITAPRLAERVAGHIDNTGTGEG